MLKITIVAAGKLKERFWRDACAEYLKRLSAYVHVEVREVPDSTPAKEAEHIKHALASTGATHTILLDIAGKEVSSEDLAHKLDGCALMRLSHVAFIIGGSDGVTPEIAHAADERMSFGPITLPHNLARVVLLEQLYRACKILRGEPYHK